MLKVNKTNRFLIILTYFERPNMVLNALYSITHSMYNNWHVAFYDDGSKTPGEPIAREIIPPGKITFYKNEMPLEEKMACGGNIGENLNAIIKAHLDCDAAILLADDDAIQPDYLTKLDGFFAKNKNTYAVYNYISPYNPMKETYFTAVRNFKPNVSHMSGFSLDASQVAWQLSANKFLNVWFPERGLKGFDTKFFEKLRQTGLIWPTGDYGQFKGTHPKQLGKCDHRWAMSGGKIDCDKAPQLPEEYAVDFAVNEFAFAEDGLTLNPLLGKPSS